MKLILQAIKSMFRGIEASRTCWEETKEVILVDNYTSAEYQENINVPSCNFVPKQKYNVTWNGVLYENVVCYTDGEYNVLGGDGSGYPFYLDDDGGNNFYVDCEEDEEFTVSVSTIETVVHKLDKKYLPDNMATIEQVEAAQDAAYEAQDAANMAQDAANMAQDMANDAMFPILKITSISRFNNGTIRCSVSDNVTLRDGGIYGVVNVADTTIDMFEPMPYIVINNSVYAIYIRVLGVKTIQKLENLQRLPYLGHMFTKDMVSVMQYSAKLRGFISLTHGDERSNFLTNKVMNVVKKDYSKFIVWHGDTLTGEFAVSDQLIIPSSTEGSKKRFKIMIDDSGTISATELTE